jgi:hypothetical protein
VTSRSPPQAPTTKTKKEKTKEPHVFVPVPPADEIGADDDDVVDESDDELLASSGAPDSGAYSFASLTTGVVLFAGTGACA